MHMRQAAVTAIGSLVPDADAVDATIFHTEVKGTKGSNADILNVIGPFFPVFGWVTKYLIYSPAVWIYDAVVFGEYDIAASHRGLLHSILGLGTLTLLTGLYMAPVLFALGLLSAVTLGAFLVAYLAGAVLHLLEDSCTKTGIQWNYPFQSWKLKGQLSTTAHPEDTQYPEYFSMVLGGAAAAMFFLPLVVERLPFYVFPAIGAAVAVVLWAAFARIVAKCRVYP